MNAMLYASEAVAAISISRSQYIQEKTEIFEASLQENVNLR